MGIKINYKHTLAASCIGSVTQSIVNNFAPLLFLTFQSTYGISLEKITLLVTINFVLQFFIDLAAAKFIDKIGYRAGIVAAHICTGVGLASFSFLPEIFADPYIGLLLCVTLCAIGGGLDEVLISPIVESCPTKRKAAVMSFLHSFYSWGSAFVIVISTIFFLIFGIENWKWMACIWAILPLFDANYCLFVPIYNTHEENKKGIKLKQLFSMKIFWVLALLMMSSGAAELSMSQWASAFAESALGVDKTVGDIAGPCMFAVLMGISRSVYAKFSEKIDLTKFMVFSAVLCMVSYVTVTLSPSPVLSLIACGACGFSVGIMWPGTVSIAAKNVKCGGTALFAMLALFGDVGATAGPTIVGFASGALGDDLQKGLIFGIVFPVLLLLGIFLIRRMKKKASMPQLLEK